MKKRYTVEGMTCAACQAHVEKAIRGIDGVEDVSVNLLRNTMDVTFDRDKVTEDSMASALDKAGYTLVLDNKKMIEKKKDSVLLELCISAVFLILLMYFSMGNMMWGWWAPPILDMEECPMGFALIQFFLTLPILYLNRKYFINGFKRLFHGANMDSLIALGATASMAYSIYCLFRIAYDPSDKNMYHMSLYFEAAGMILVFVSLGKYLEGLSKRRTTRSLEKLMDLAPKTAKRLNKDKEEEISISNVRVGDFIVVKTGELIPVDGRVIQGMASINMANITGESIPVHVEMEAQVLASTTVVSGYIVVEATKVAKDSTIEEIIRLVEEASESKAPISKLADKVAGIFVPIILAIACIVFLGNLMYIQLAKPTYIQNAFSTSLNYAITVLVIACPCALGLATPVAIMVGTGKGAENGLIIKNAEVLEACHKVKTVVLDKTGTITNGKPEVTDFDIDISYLNILASMEALSSHPLAKAVTEYAKLHSYTSLEIEEFRAQEGEGVFGRFDGHVYYIGNIRNHEVDEETKKRLNSYQKDGKTGLVFFKDEECIGTLAVRDEIKGTSKEAIAKLKALGIRVVMLTGDHKLTAEAIAKEAGIDQVISEVYPLEKAKVIDSLKNPSGMVAMVGDGVNDALALASADLGIAIGAGSDVAIESANIVLIRNDLMDVASAILLSKRVIRTIKIGLFWAFFYNFICVFLASGILYHITKGSFQMKPEYGSIAMSLSSVSVVLNALTINFFHIRKKEDNIVKEEIQMGKLVLGVEGMMCKHCKAHVEAACKKIANVTDAVASLEENNVTVSYVGTVSEEDIKKSIIDAGYEVK